MVGKGCRPARGPAVFLTALIGALIFIVVVVNLRPRYLRRFQKEVPT